MKKAITILLFIFFFFISFANVESEESFEYKIRYFIIKFEAKNDNNYLRILKLKRINNNIKKINNKKNNKKLKFVIDFFDHKIYEYYEILRLKSFKRVAHAGGIYNGKTYTNSIDALNYNKNYYNLFEIDFSWTKDNKLVCIHDFNGSFTKSFGFSLNGEIPTYNEFLGYVNNNNLFKNCTLDSLISWLNLNPNKYIITDIKSDNIKGLNYIKDNYPEYVDRFIPQFYNLDDYFIIKNMGYKKIILTLYICLSDNYTISQKIKNKKMDLFAVTMPLERVYSGLPKLLDNYYIYSHTINSYEDFEILKKLGVNEIYTDKLIK